VTAASENYPGQKGRSFTITRTFDAPRRLVFDAFIKPEHLVHWHHAGEGWKTPFAETDPRPGGKLRIGYGSPDGKEDFVLEGTYREVRAPELIVYVIDDRPVEVTFEELGAKTRVTVEVTLETEYHEDVQRGGWTEHIDNLATYLATKTGKGGTPEMTTTTKLDLTTPSDTEIRMTREFNAPRELVFRVMSDPKHIPSYWGPRNTTTIVDKMDFRVGGKWRFVHKSPDGDTAFRGEYKEIVPPERVVMTFEWEGLLGHISTDTMVLDDIGGGRTRITATSRFANKEDRDGMLQSGMESGARDLYDRLEELLAALQKGAR